jgi:hypothetical protein
MDASHVSLRSVRSDTPQEIGPPTFRRDRREGPATPELLKTSPSVEESVAAHQIVSATLVGTYVVSNIRRLEPAHRRPIS